MALTGIDFQTKLPPVSLSGYIESFWLLQNQTDEEKEVVILPDGRVDVFFSYSATEPYHVSLAGLGSLPSSGKIAAQSLIFAVSFKLSAVEYILDKSISDLTDAVIQIPADYWGVGPDDLQDFDSFCSKVSAKIQALLSKHTIDTRKQKLFDLIYTFQGALAVHELADAVGWSSRQINRYFNQWFGLSLKTYSTILRYRASFGDIKEGKLFSEQNFVDQAHFIKDVKKYSGVTPKELAKNKNDRFIQFSTLSKK